jgi:hypothetical protein
MPSTPVIGSQGSIDLFQSASATGAPLILPNFFTLKAVGLGEDTLQRTFEVLDVSGSPVLQTTPAVAANGTLFVSPIPLTNGTVRVSVRLRVSPGVYFNNVSPVRTFSIVVQSVNRQPSFDIPDFVAVAEDEGLKTIQDFAQNISIGDREAGQLSTFTVTSDAAYLFTAQPEISMDGTLSFGPVSGRYFIIIVIIIYYCCVNGTLS